MLIVVLNTQGKSSKDNVGLKVFSSYPENNLLDSVLIDVLDPQCK